MLVLVAMCFYFIFFVIDGINCLDRGPGPIQTSLNNFIKLSFKDGLNDYFVKEFRNALSAKRWEFVSPGNQQPIQNQRPVSK